MRGRLSTSRRRLISKNTPCMFQVIIRPFASQVLLCAVIIRINDYGLLLSCWRHGPCTVSGAFSTYARYAKAERMPYELEKLALPVWVVLGSRDDLTLNVEVFSLSCLT